MSTSNADVAKLFREVAAAYIIKKVGNIFQIRAYENASDAIEHSTSEIKDLWEENSLDQIPGLGKSIRAYLEEFFKTGKVAHFEDVKKGIPKVVFEMLEIPGIGPKTAQELAKLGVKDLVDLQTQIKTGELVKKGFSAKIAQKIMDGIREINSREGRMPLPYASKQAEIILEYLRKCSDVLSADSLGSLRRKVATIGDLDFAVSSNNPEKIVEHFVLMPSVSRIIEKGKNGASVMLKSGLHVDLLVGDPKTYGALLQHFTGSKQHNIKLRIYAEKLGFSLSEYGIRKVSRDKKQETRDKVQEMGDELILTKTEDEFYQILGMDTPDPEIREDTGEIEAGLSHKLPKLVKISDIKGDLHLHSNFPNDHPSHAPGADSIESIVKKAIEYKYEYVGISDHPPGHASNSKEEIIKWVEKRTKVIQSIEKNTKSIRVQHTKSGSSTHSIRILNSLEVDILTDGSISVPDEALATLDYCIAGIHHGHRGSKVELTKRLLKAMENPYIDIISHPSNRLLNERESSDIDWEEVFKIAGKNKKILEIDAFPNRLDLRDNLVRMALKYGVRFSIDTDAHEVGQMDNMQFGVSVARRGWATKDDIVNTWDFSKFAKFFEIKI